MAFAYARETTEDCHSRSPFDATRGIRLQGGPLSGSCHESKRARLLTRTRSAYLRGICGSSSDRDSRFGAGGLPMTSRQSGERRLLRVGSVRSADVRRGSTTHRRRLSGALRPVARAAQCWRHVQRRSPQVSGPVRQSSHRRPAGTGHGARRPLRRRCRLYRGERHVLPGDGGRRGVARRVVQGRPARLRPLPRPPHDRFRSYDVNGMFRSLGNIVVNDRVALLFVNFSRTGCGCTGQRPWPTPTRCCRRGRAPRP